MKLGLRASLVALAVSLGCRTEPPSPAATASSSAPTPPHAPARAVASGPAPSPTASRSDVRATSASAAANAHHVMLVSVAGMKPAAPSTLPLVTLSPTELLVGDEHIADLSPGPLGFDASIKRAGQRSALQLLPLDDVLKRLHAREPSGTEIRFLFDRRVAYRAALEVIFTASHEGFTSFDFVVESAASEGVAERSLPASTPDKAEWEASHTPGAAQPASFVLTTAGAMISVGTVTIGAGCTKGGAGAAVATLDPSAVGACTARIKGMDPAWSSTHVANVSAANGLDLQSVLAVVGAILPSFPTVHFGMIQG